MRRVVKEESEYFYKVASDVSGAVKLWAIHNKREPRLLLENEE